MLKASNTAVSSAEIVSNNGSVAWVVARSPEAGADAPSEVTAIEAAINEISFFMQVSRKKGGLFQAHLRIRGNKKDEKQPGLDREPGS